MRHAQTCRRYLTGAPCDCAWKDSIVGRLKALGQWTVLLTLTGALFYLALLVQLLTPPQ